MNISQSIKHDLEEECFKLQSNQLHVDRQGDYFYKASNGEIRGPFATKAQARFDFNNFSEALELENEIKEWSRAVM
ncbi:hypothetical protein [Pleionea sediminis]|uniref:hypothetical protein n=1 Tax=Pleionea sediminis TaxID=2569479 RepID=UPI00118649AF|nr:hypothetical protein [Pleionea sediminis]